MAGKITVVVVVNFGVAGVGSTPKFNFGVAGVGSTPKFSQP